MGITFRLQEKALYRMVNALLLFGICLFGAGSYFGILQPADWHVVAGVGILLLLVVYDSMDAKGRILEGACLAGCLGSVIMVAGPDRCLDFLINYGHWLLGIAPWEKEWAAGYGILQSIFIALICHLVQRILEKDVRIKAVAALLLLAGLVYCFFAEQKVSHVGVALAICYPVLVLVEVTQRHWKKVRSRSVQAYMLWLTPFLALYLVVLLWVPIPEEPYDWKFFRDIYSRISESVKISSHSLFGIGREDFDTGLSGFSAEGNVGTGVQQDRREIMSIQSNVSLRTNVYLAGKIYDTFDGRQWKKEKQDIAGEHYLDARNTLYAVRNYDREYQEDYLRTATLLIRYEDFHSRYLFAPLKTQKLEWEDRKLEYEEKEGSLLFSERVGYGMEYVVTYYQLNMGQEVFHEFLEAAPEIPGKMISEEELAAYEQAVYGNYLETVELSEEVSRFLEQTIGDAETKPDKLKKIEEMLSGMSYTHVPGAMPDKVVDGSSFLDFFLLESKEGYCSHFATAFVLLARAEGIPARYVQGYCVPMEASSEIMVTSDKAHAWPEVYIDNIGWIPFEPTPGYGEVRYTPWKIKKGETKVPTTPGQPATAPEWEEEEQEPDAELPEPEDNRDETTSRDFGKVLKVLLAAVVSVVAIGAVTLVLDRVMNRCRYRKMTDAQKYRVEIRKNMKLLSWLQMGRAEGETLEEFRCRVNDVPELEVIRFVEEYEEFLYGSRCVDTRMLHQLLQEQEVLLEILKAKRKGMYFYYLIFVR